MLKTYTEIVNDSTKSKNREKELTSLLKNIKSKRELIVELIEENKIYKHLGYENEVDTVIEIVAEHLKQYEVNGSL